MEQYDIDEKLEQGYIQCQTILEILGAPKEHVTDTLNLVLKKLKEEKDVHIVSETVHEAKEKDKMFSAFAEIELLFKDFATLTRICFDYMPSNIEIIKPDNFKIPAVEFSNFIGDMLAALHEIDYKLKDVHANRALVEKNSSNLLKNCILLSISSGKNSIEEISRVVGIKPDQLEPFMKAFSDEGFVKKNGNVWEKA